MKKILYVLTSLSHKRVFEPFIERKDAIQAIAGPPPIISSKNNIVPEDYSDFSIKKIFTLDPSKMDRSIQRVVSKFKPDVYVQSSFVMPNIKFPDGCKKVAMSHGLTGNHVVDLVKTTDYNTKGLNRADMYVGAPKYFKNFVELVAGKNKEVITDIIPQFDIIHNPKYYNSFRHRVLSQTKNPNPNRVILFIGFCCKDRKDFCYHNEDYFKSVMELERIARNNNWLVMVKPRHSLSKMISFLSTHSWGKQYIKKYTAIQGSKFLHFITTTGHIYRYFFADAFVMNGTSTAEIEACAIQKPLFIIRTRSEDKTDPFNTITAGAAEHIRDIGDLENILIRNFTNGAFHYPEAQLNHLSSLGIVFDGKNSEHVQDILLK